ncbi:MAG: hypothetical protein HXS54_00070 [Theionarchaea archaeon]|nr:hypothetical protein [Theionarchaea archaeon]
MQKGRESLKREYRGIYEILWENPRVLVRSITSKIGSDAGKLLKEAQNLREYMYFINCENPELLYLKYREDRNIIYHVKTLGFCNLWITAKEKISIDGDILVEGQRSDYYVSHPADHNWETAIEIIKKKIETFDLRDYEPKGIIQEQFNKTTDWDLRDELLYRYFKYDLRKPLTPLMRDLNISKDKIYDFLGRLPEPCSVFTDYYPESLSAYYPCLFMFETDYAGFVIDLFSELPATSSFFKVSNKLFANIHVPKKLDRIDDSNPSNRLSIPLLALDLKEKGIVKKKDYVVLEYYRSKNI